MAIVQTIGFYEFARAFQDMGRADHFSKKAQRIIFDYLENLSEETGNNEELDVVGYCCNYVENDCADIFVQYKLQDSSDYSNDDLADIARDFLEENTVIIGEYINKQGANVFVYQEF